MKIRNLFFLALLIISNWAGAQITDYSVFEDKLNFYVANDWDVTDITIRNLLLN